MINNRLLDYIIKEQLAPQLFRGNFGLEKENVRVDDQGRLALTPHPKAFGDKLKNPYIKTDFSESQIEVVTSVCSSLEEVYCFLENLQDIVSLSLDGEYLWPQSNPPVLPDDEAIPIAVYETEGIEQRKYRERLAEKYGRKKQLLSGIHYNFSFSEEFLKALHRAFDTPISYKQFKDNIYLKITRSFLKYRWLLIYLTGASPAFHNSFEEKFLDVSEKLDNESHYFADLSSLRNSKCGYKNEEDFDISYNSVEEYVDSIQSLIKEGKIESASEFYNSIRLKGKDSKGALDQLKDEGINYIELRIFDLNPFCRNGMFLEDLYLVHLLIIYLFLREENKSHSELQTSDGSYDLSTVFGGPEGVSVFSQSGEMVGLKEVAQRLLDDLMEIVKALNFKTEYLTTIVESAREKVLDPAKTYAHRIIEGVKSESYVGFHMQKAKEYLHDSSKKFNLSGYEDLELSTQILIKDAIRRGITFEILDRSEDFIRLRRGQRAEYVKQATKTSRDSYSTVLIMENKVVTKEVLKEHNLRVPFSESFNTLEDAVAVYARYKGKKIVIKPKSTNFGIGITIFKDGFTEEQFERAVSIALSNDKTVLVEEYISGKEYRFLVISGEVVAVLHRVPANVRGDGQKTVRELVMEKNKDPLRGTGHKTPLEKIALGEIEELFLKTQGKDFEYKPKEGEVVFLRENSNISTGGDSIDYTGRVHKSYSDIAVKSAKAVGAAITGVDMIIQDIEEEQDENNYAIIELNFNPAMYMHCYPYQGVNRRVGDKILDLLFDK